MRLFYQLLHLDPTSLGEFLGEFRSKVHQINKLMETGQGTPQEVLRHAFRLLHGIKGEAALLELDFLADAAHSLEDQVAILQKKEDLANADFLGFTLKFGEFQEVGHRMEALVDRLATFQSDFVQGNREATLDPTRGALARRLETLVQRTAEETDRRAALTLDAFDAELLAPHGSRWKDILVQLVRNAVVHGIETPKERRSVGKPEEGRISVSVARRGGHVTVTVRDDGRGLDPVFLGQKAVAAGFPAARVRTWTKTDLLRFLFTDGVSTAGETSPIAGRGVGLSLVSSLVKQAGGRIGARFEAGRFLEFEISLPDPRDRG
jgi:Amt family ammonium transporter